MPTPYAEHLDGRDPVAVLKATLDDFRALRPKFTPGSWAESWAPGKWSLQQLMLHVAQWEMIFGVRVRCALGVPGYEVQPLDQDPLMVAEQQSVDGPAAFAAFEAMRAMNVLMASGLTAAQRRQTCLHPERGTITVDDLLTTLAGHAIHHLAQFRQGLHAV
jgi:hypothetical protein